MGKRLLPYDFKEFIQCLNSNDVRYLLVGGWAVGLYGNPRATKDIDFLISPADDNVNRLQGALRDFGAPTVGNEVFQEPGNVFRMGVSPVQIDIINQATGIEFDRCYDRREVVEADGIEIFVISRGDLIANKNAAGRHRDLADVEFLEEDDG